MTPWLSAAAAVTFTAPRTVAVFTGALTEAVGGVVSTLKTVTLTGADVVRLPAMSRPTAVSACVPFDVRFEFQLMLYGLAVSSAPRFAPSIVNRQAALPRVALADADPVT